MSDPFNHLGSIWYHSEPLEVPHSPNQFLGWDFFCRFLQQTGSSINVHCIITSYHFKFSHHSCFGWLLCSHNPMAYFCFCRFDHFSVSCNELITCFHKFWNYELFFSQNFLCVVFLWGTNFFFNWDQNIYTKKSDWTLCIRLKNQRRFCETNSWNQNSSKHVMSSFLFDSFQRNWKFSHQSVNKRW